MFVAWCAPGLFITVGWDGGGMLLAGVGPGVGAGTLFVLLLGGGMGVGKLLLLFGMG